jgi:hypothetical protein
MKRAIGMTLVLVAGLSQPGALPSPQPVLHAQRETAEAAARAVTAANAFLGTLDAGQRSRVSLPLRSDLRARWSNLPTGIVMQPDRERSKTPLARNGLKLGELTPAQQDAAFALLRATLSTEGYQKIVDIVNSDEELEKRAGPTRAANSTIKFGRAEYYVAILGQPSTTAPWMIQFGGHHLAINLTISGASRTIAPSHLGAQPAVFTLDSRTVRPLGDELDKAVALVNALDAAQRKQAILNFTVADTVLAAGEDGKVIQPEGVKASTFTPAQQRMLMDVVAEWVNVIDEAGAAVRLRQIQSGLGDTWFAWSGPTTKEGGAYFRIQGPTVVIEYAPQALNQRGPDGAPEHIHTIYRDPTNDYGRTFTGK